MDLPLISAALLATSSPLAYGEGIKLAQPASTSPVVTADSSEQDSRPSENPRENNPGEDATLRDAGQEQVGEPVEEGDIVVTADSEARKRDPLVDLNESTFALTQDVDKAVVEPVAIAYKEGLPKPVRRGLRNFFRNLLEPVNFLNYLLQLKPGKAFETLGRFTINSTVGVAGLIDVAKEKPFNLPYRRNGFANTLGYYGVGPGPFLVLPLIGATSLRDVLGSGLDQAVLPIAVGSPFNKPEYGIPAYTVNSLEFRIDFDERLEAINSSDDPYFALRETYLCQREADIAALKNRPPPRDCNLEALLSEGLEGDASQQSLTLEGALEQTEDYPAETLETRDNDGVAQQEQEQEITEPTLVPGPVVEIPSSITLENGCALLEERVNTFHVITC